MEDDQTRRRAKACGPRPVLRRRSPGRDTAPRGPPTFLAESHSPGTSLAHSNRRRITVTGPRVWPMDGSDSRARTVTGRVVKPGSNEGDPLPLSDATEGRDSSWPNRDGLKWLPPVVGFLSCRFIADRAARFRFGVDPRSASRRAEPRSFAFLHRPTTEPAALQASRARSFKASRRREMAER